MSKKDKRIKELEERVDKLERILESMRETRIARLRSEADFFDRIKPITYEISGMYDNTGFDCSFIRTKNRGIK